VRTRFISLAAMTAILISAAFGEDFWVKKSYHKWSKEETHKMLTDSPWAKSVSLGMATNPTGVGDTTAVNAVVTTGPVTNAGAFYAGDSAEGEMAPGITYTAQFRSAEPIREALVRTQELTSHYDTLSGDAKSRFEASESKFLSATFPDRILLCVTVNSNVQGYVSALRTYWSAQSVPKLSMTTFLNAGTEKLSLVGYGFKDDTIQFVFPRPKNLGAEETFTLEFVHPTIQRLYEQRMLVSFHTKKMEIKGQPAM